VLDKLALEGFMRGRMVFGIMSNELEFKWDKSKVAERTVG
jgi:hypothetical protein